MEANNDKLSIARLQAADALFKEPVSFVLSVANLSQLPTTDIGEVAFSGRSNVGKSSIINALFGQKKLAKTSNTPGRTQQLNYFNLNDKIHIVDLPGYGYAEAPESQVRQWQNLIFDYLRGRVHLKRVFLLIDSRHGLKKVDKEIMEMLDKAAVTFITIPIINLKKTMNMNKELICFIAVTLLSTAITTIFNLFAGIVVGIVWCIGIYEVSIAPCEKTPEID